MLLKFSVFSGVTIDPRVRGPGNIVKMFFIEMLRVQVGNVTNTSFDGYKIRFAVAESEW